MSSFSINTARGPLACQPSDKFFGVLSIVREQSSFVCLFFVEKLLNNLGLIEKNSRTCNKFTNQILTSQQCGTKKNQQLVFMPGLQESSKR